MTERENLYNDIQHWRRRMRDQYAYIDDVWSRYLKGDMSRDTKDEVMSSAKVMLTIIQNRVYDLRVQAAISER